MVPHRSTNQARRCLTSLSRREAVLSTWYGRSCHFKAIKIHNQPIHATNNNKYLFVKASSPAGHNLHASVPRRAPAGSASRSISHAEGGRPTLAPPATSWMDGERAYSLATGYVARALRAQGGSLGRGSEDGIIRGT